VGKAAPGDSKNPGLPMNLHLPTLMVLCVAALAASAGVMTLFGSTQRIYRGYWWWVGAQWLLATGLALQLMRDSMPAVLPLANLLILQWPIVVLAGMRRFYSRAGLRTPALLDWVLLALAYGIWLASWAMNGGVAVRVATFAGGAAVLHLYGATLLWRLREFRSSSALKVLVAIEVLGASVQLVRATAGLQGLGTPSPRDELLLASGLVIVFSSLVMVYLALLLTNERSEANLRAMHRKLRFLADMDMLTRVPNRRHFHELADRTLAATRPQHCALMMFDIDHFKRVNDELGHARGDEALRDVARCVRDVLRTQDVAGRLGGDEFAVLLPETSVQDAMAVAARIVARLDARAPSAQQPRLSLSFGVVQMYADETVPEALRRADQGLYEAKRQGRSRAVIAFGFEAQPVFSDSQPLGMSAG
jgi:diguanylate cyclase (GGDEF)-like protein